MIDLEYAYKIARNGTKVIAYEVVNGSENIFDFMLFAANEYKATKHYYDKNNMKLAYKTQHREPEAAREIREFCKTNNYTFGITCFCEIKNDFTTGFSIVKPWLEDILLFTTLLDESEVDIEQKLAELLAKYNKGETDAKTELN